MPRPDTTSQLYVTAVYAVDGAEALERSQWFPPDTPIGGLLEWARAFRLPDHDTTLVALQIHPGDQGVR